MAQLLRSMGHPIPTALMLSLGMSLAMMAAGCGTSHCDYDRDGVCPPEDCDDKNPLVQNCEDLTSPTPQEDTPTSPGSTPTGPGATPPSGGHTPTGPGADTPTPASHTPTDADPTPTARDGDDDGFGDYDEGGVDCDDGDDDVYPGATESCDGEDEDCDGFIDEDAGVGWYMDGDEDGFGGASVAATACERPEGMIGVAGDCNDGAATIHPGAEEVCDDVDQDCDGIADDGLDIVWYLDRDEDTYGDPASSLATCEQPPGYVSNALDCDDRDDEARPGAAETCDPGDDDCDGEADEGLSSVFYLDADGDGYGTDSSPAQGCVAPEGYATEGGDCDDSDPSFHPYAVDAPDGLDQDCDGQADGGVTYHPSCVEIKRADPAATSNAYTIDPDGAGPNKAYGVYCQMTIEGGGWQLISSRYAVEGSLLGDRLCGNPENPCSGKIPMAQVPSGPSAPELLFSTSDYGYWMLVDNLEPLSADGLLSVLTLNRELTTSSDCTYPHYCYASVDPDLRVATTSANISPSTFPINKQYAYSGGFRFYSEVNEVPTFRMEFNINPCANTALILGYLSSHNPSCGERGAMFFRFERP